MLLRKQFIIFVVIGVVIVLSLFLLSLILGSSQHNPSYQSSSVTAVPTNSDNAATGSSDTVTPASSQVSHMPAEKYSADTYYIYLPTGWVASEHAVANGGTFVQIAPHGLPSSFHYPAITIETDPIKVDLSTREMYLQEFGYSKSTMMIGGESADKFSGTLPEKDLSGQHLLSPTQITTIMIQHGQLQYLITYGYSGAKPDSNMEEFFSQTLASFGFK